MAKLKVRKNTKNPGSNQNNGNEVEVSLDQKEDVFQDHEVERQSAAIRALRDVEIEQLCTMLRLLRSYFSKEQLQVPLLQYFKENLPNLSIVKVGKDGQHEVQLKDKDHNLYMNQADERTIHASLLHRLSMVYPDCSAAMPSFGGFEFSNKTVKTNPFYADNLQIRSLVLEESENQMLELQDGLKTPNTDGRILQIRVDPGEFVLQACIICGNRHCQNHLCMFGTKDWLTLDNNNKKQEKLNNQRLSVGMTPKTLRLPKHGEMLLSVHGSPLGLYKEDMETIQESEDG